MLMEHLRRHKAIITIKLQHSPFDPPLLHPSLQRLQLFHVALVAERDIVIVAVEVVLVEDGGGLLHALEGGEAVGTARAF